MALGNNPFAFHEITLNLSIRQLKTLIDLLKASNPSYFDEDLVIQIVTDLDGILRNIESK